MTGRLHRRRFKFLINEIMKEKENFGTRLGRQTTLSNRSAYYFSPNAKTFGLLNNFNLQPALFGKVWLLHLTYPRRPAVAGNRAAWSCVWSGNWSVERAETQGSIQS